MKETWLPMVFVSLASPDSNQLLGKAQEIWTPDLTDPRCFVGRLARSQIHHQTTVDVTGLDMRPSFFERVMISSFIVYQCLSITSIFPNPKKKLQTKLRTYAFLFSKTSWSLLTEKNNAVNMSSPLGIWKLLPHQSRLGMKKLHASPVLWGDLPKGGTFQSLPAVSNPFFLVGGFNAFEFWWKLGICQNVCNIFFEIINICCFLKHICENVDQFCSSCPIHFPTILRSWTIFSKYFHGNLRVPPLCHPPQEIRPY